MSCGKPHETGCSEVLGVVYRFLDGEIDEFIESGIRWRKQSANGQNA